MQAPWGIAMKETELDEDLVGAYRATLYEVFGAEGLTLRIGAACGELSRLMAEHGARCAAFVTACNPRSQALSEEVNRERGATLLADLVAEGRVCLAGQGRHPDGGWPPEPSLLVLGLDRVAASELGRRWDQNAVVWVGEDATPELVLLR